VIREYDVIVPVGEKDISRVRMCLNSLRFLFPAPKGIYVIAPRWEKKVDFDAPAGTKVVFLRDDDFLVVERKGFAPNWTFQQCIKLMQGFTECPWYMSVDSDVVFVRPLEVMTADRKPIFWRMPFASFGTVYDEMMKEAWGINKVIPHSMICHMMMFHRDACRDIMRIFLVRHPKTEGVDDRVYFYDWMVGRQTSEKQLSEFETYANYTEGRYPGVYEHRILYGKDGSFHGQVDKELVEMIVRTLSSEGDNDMITIHVRTGT
jgi:hypothetical protein